ncbi:ADP-glyceromanno-heptose 6-epimerase [Prolixibacteraceae bacterium JC049]|nr:ADP-glyceromanno-heptose 6-epimerase [Prolixibacteraceae bacterium JC049]
MIIITGAAGFIGSNLVRFLNDNNYNDLVLVDHFGNEEKLQNIADKKYTLKIDRKDFWTWLEANEQYAQFVIHLGARTDTTETDTSIFDELNLNFSKRLWQYCSEYQIPLVYASSAATYGNGELGFHDKHELSSELKPLNEYGRSKNNFDQWALEQEKQPFFWAGLKFFNVYGPNEYHKNRMASVVYHAFNTIKATGKMQLFRSHRPDFKDGEQSRDFIYVKDICEVIYFLMENRKQSGIYNVGTGKARSFYDLVAATFSAMDLTPDISFKDTPEDIRENYQYFTEAPMQKLKALGFDKPFTTLEEGVKDYVQNYLKDKKRH